MEEFNVILENILDFLKTDGVTLARNISIILLFFMLIKIKILKRQYLISLYLY